MKPSGIAEVRRVRNTGGSSKLDPTAILPHLVYSGGRRRSPFHRTSPTSFLPSSSFLLSQAHFFVIEFTLLSFFRHLLIGFSRRRGFPPILLLCFFVSYGDESQALLCLWHPQGTYLSVLGIPKEHFLSGQPPGLLLH